MDATALQRQDTQLDDEVRWQRAEAEDPQGEEGTTALKFEIHAYERGRIVAIGIGDTLEKALKMFAEKQAENLNRHEQETQKAKDSIRTVHEYTGPS